jgi:hypothetical protein
MDLERDTVTCPAGVTITIRRHKDGPVTAGFGDAYATCRPREQCTSSPSGRVVSVNRNEAALTLPCSPRRTTSHASPSSGSDPRQRDGRPHETDGPFAASFAPPRWSLPSGRSFRRL